MMIWKPLLAATLPAGYDLDTLPYPLWGSPKIDGFRCLIQNGEAVSRKGIPFRNSAVQWLYGRKEYEGLDGELVVGKPYAADVFNRVQNVVNDGKEKAANDFHDEGCLWVIDCFGDTDFERTKLTPEKPQIKVIPQIIIRNAAQLRNFEERCLRRGYEGVMLRKYSEYPQKPGKENRSTLREFYLVKLKRFDYAEARILQAHLLEHNLNDEKTATGKRSSKKSGMVVDAERIGSVTLTDGKRVFDMTVPTNELRNKGPRWWNQQLGKTVRYKFQLVGTKDKPRIATCEFKELL